MIFFLHDDKQQKFYSIEVDLFGWKYPILLPTDCPAISRTRRN